MQNSGKTPLRAGGSPNSIILGLVGAAPGLRAEGGRSRVLWVPVHAGGPESSPDPPRIPTDPPGSPTDPPADPPGGQARPEARRACPRP